MIFGIAAFDAFLTGPLFNQGCGGFKVLPANDGFMVICHIVLVELAVIFVAVKAAVGIGLLENAVAGVLLILDNVANAGRGPVAAFLGWNILLI